jgi:hypothetical protein
MLIDQSPTKSFLHLSLSSKLIVYKNFSFYDLGSILPSIPKKCILKERILSSCLDLLFRDYFTYNFFIKFDKTTEHVLRTQVIFFTPTYLYIDTGKKYTILKPKFKVFFSCKATNLFRKEVLILNYFCFFSFFSSPYLYSLFNLFLVSPFKKTYSLSNKIFFSQSRFFLRKIFIFYTAPYQYFFFYTVYNYKLSHYQKKINFLQFSIFFKNININYLRAFF